MHYLLDRTLGPLGNVTRIPEVLDYKGNSYRSTNLLLIKVSDDPVSANMETICPCLMDPSKVKVPSRLRLQHLVCFGTGGGGGNCH